MGRPGPAHRPRLRAGKRADAAGFPEDSPSRPTRFRSAQSPNGGHGGDGPDASERSSACTRQGDRLSKALGGCFGLCSPVASDGSLATGLWRYERETSTPWHPRSNHGKARARRQNACPAGQKGPSSAMGDQNRPATPRLSSSPTGALGHRGPRVPRASRQRCRFDERRLPKRPAGLASVTPSDGILLNCGGKCPPSPQSPRLLARGAIRAHRTPGKSSTPRLARMKQTFSENLRERSNSTT